MRSSLPIPSTRSTTVASSDERSTSEIAVRANHSTPDRGRFCGLCGHQNPGTVKQCLNCNAALGKNCPNCTQPVPTDSKFCGQCGTHLPDAPPPPATSSSLGTAQSNLRPNLRTQMPTALAEKITAASVKTPGERREVTVLFLDVTNFTVASHNLDNEDVYNFINDAMSTLVQVIRKYGGTIDKFTGDGLMALFGAPVAYENDPERAVKAALEMQTALQPLQKHINHVHGFNLQIRIGINTGWVIAGKLGNNFHKEYTVIGDTVNLASRLETAAEPGTILVSAETYQRTRTHIKYRTLLPLAVKGIPDPVQAYRPLNLLETPGAGHSLPHLQVPMVGRNREFVQLQDAMVTVRHFHHRQIVLITGEAGVGKSRVVAEFQRTLVWSDIKVYQGNCSAYTHNNSLSVVAKLFRNMFDLPETAPADYQRETVLNYLNQYNLDPDETLPYLIHVLGLEQSDPQLTARLELLDAAMLQRQTHTALRKVLLAEARLCPIVLILEDLHWVDSASKDFLEYLIQTTDDIPLLLLFASRETKGKTVLQPLIETSEKNPERRVILSLQPLSETERQLLVDQLITETATDASSLKRRIAERAEGNPFYTEEIIRMLIDQGGLVRSKTSGPWEVTSQADDLLGKIPGTIKGLILARFDRLPESVRQTLQKAAVIGPSFPVSLLHMFNNMSIKTMGVHLDELDARHFLCPQPFRSEPGYTFRHALFQEMAYSTLLKRDRRQLHTQVAQAIEQGHAWLPEEKTEALAYHYVRSTEPTLAIPHLITGAENAARRCAYETAIEHYRWAIKLLPAQSNGHNQDFFKVRIGLGRSLKFIGQLTEAGQILSEVLQYLWDSSITEEPVKLWPVLIEVLRQLADVRQREGIYDEALALLEAGLQVLGETGAQEQPSLWYSLLDRMAWIRFRQGQLEEASALAHAATAELNPEKVNDPIKLASLYNTLGGVCWQQGHLDKAVSYVKQSLRLHEKAGYFWGKAIAYGNLGVLYDTLGNWPKALEYFDQAHTLQETIGDRQHRIVNLNNLGFVYLRMGKHRTARRTLETGQSLALSMGDTWGAALCHVGLAEISLIQSNLKEAQQHIDEALAIADDIGSSEIQIQARRFLALTLANNGEELQAGLKVAAKALTMSQEAKLLTEEANCYRVLGILYAHAGQYTEAETYLQDSATLSLEQNDPYRQGQALLEMGRFYLTRAQADPSLEVDWKTKALAVLNEAADRFEALGAAYDLHLTQTVLGQIQAHNQIRAEK